MVGHGDVHHDDIDLALAHDVQRLAPIGGFGHHAEIALIGEELVQADAYHRMVVNDGNSNHGVGPSIAPHDPTFLRANA